jgi:spermidine synthase
MKKLFVLTLISLGSASPAWSAASAIAPDYTESYDTPYNNLTVQKIGSVVELRARSRAAEYLESAVDLSDPLRLVVPYTRSLFGAVFLEPKPKAVLMIGLGGAGFHRVFSHGFPGALLQTVELDPKVFELCQSRLNFLPTDKTPVATMDGRLYVKRSKQMWDWLILDAFRAGFVPPHLKTQEFYRECAAHMSDRGVFVTNLHATTELYASDLKTIQSVFPQVILFQTPGRGNVIACAVKYTTPSISDPAKWAAVAELNPMLASRVNFKELADEKTDVPVNTGRIARVLTDDFSPVEFLDAMKVNNTKAH